MRKLSLSLVATTVLALSACDRDTTGPAKPSTATMSAVIDGASWSADSITIDSLAPSSIVIFGTKATQTLAIAIPVDPGLGTQTVGGTTPVFAGLISGPQSWLASRTQGGAGSVTLTTVTPGHIVGTFEFTLAAHEGALPSERHVGSGRFDVKY
jgi:uncharacterized protein DUF6252